MEPELLDISYSGNETTERQTATFTCVADGYPDPNIVWLHNDTLIITRLNTRREVIVSKVSSTNRPHLPMAVKSTLIVTLLRPRDAGEYLCRVDPRNLDRGRSIISEVLDMTVFPGI